MSKKTYNGVLKDNTVEQNYIHPQTNARQVLTGENNERNLEQELNAINDKFTQIKEKETDKGAFKDYNALIAKYPNRIADPLDRAGWTAIVEDEDKIYFYDTEENEWKPTASGSVGIESVNGVSGKNITLTGSEIKSTIDSTSTKTITQHLQDIKNITNDIKETKINNIPLGNGVTLNATNINTIFDDGASIQSHLADLKQKYNDHESSIEELENELNPLLNKTNVLYLSNDEMFEAVQGIVDAYENGQIVVATDNGDYKLGAIYKFNVGGTTSNPTYSWVEITSGGSGGGSSSGLETLVGTENNPVILFDLSEGVYLIKGYLKGSETGTLVKVVSEIDSSTKIEDFVKVSIHNLTTETTPVPTKVAYFYDCFSVGVTDIVIYTGVDYSGGSNIVGNWYCLLNETTVTLNAQILKGKNDYQFMQSWDQLSSTNPQALATNNTREYNPTLPYNPATKYYVDTSVEANKPIKVVDDIDADATESDANFLLSNKETGDNSKLYICKSWRGYSNFPLNELVESDYVKVDQSILNMPIPENMVETGVFGIIFKFYNKKGTTAVSNTYWPKLYVNYTNRVIQEVRWVVGYKDTYLYQNGVWEDKELILNSLSPATNIATYPYLKLETSNNTEIENEERPENYIYKCVYISKSNLYKEQVALIKDIPTDTGGGSGTTITDTLTLKKDVVVPEIPAKVGVEITGFENVETTSEFQNYGFVLNDNGYYESQNRYIEGIQSYSLCKVTFNVPETMNISWDVINSGEPNYDFGYLGKLDTDLYTGPIRDDDLNTDSIYFDFYSIGQSTTQQKITYENVSAGSHYIMFKYVKDSGAYADDDCLRFKLADESKAQEYVPSYTYESKGEIKVDDNNNLQINGDTILTEKDKSTSFIELIGTDEKPINLFDLDYGSYKLKGKIKTTKNATEIGTIKTYDSTINSYKEIDSVYVFVNNKVEDYTELFILYGFIEVNDILVSNAHWYNLQFGSKNLIYKNGGYNSHQLDLSMYVDGGSLHNTINQFDKRINELTPIVSVDDFTSINTLDNVNRLYSSNDKNNKDLYYSKITKTEKTKEDFELQKVSYNLSLDKSIVDASFDAIMEGNPTIAFTLLSFEIYDQNNNYMNDSLITVQMINGKVSQIYTNWGTVLFSDGTGWSPEGDVDDQYYNITQFVNKLNYQGNTIYLKPIFINEDYSHYNVDFSQYVCNVDINHTITPIKVATEESLNSIGEKVIYVDVTGYDGDENEISFRIPAVVGLVQTYYYDVVGYTGEIKVRISSMSTYANIITISAPSGVTINSSASLVKIKNL